MEAFGIHNQYNNISTKLLLRMLPHYYDINSNFRKKTILVKKTVDEILYYLEDRRPGQENIQQKIEKVVSLTDKIDTNVNLFFKINILLNSFSKFLYINV